MQNLRSTNYPINHQIFIHVHVCLTTILHYLESLFDSPESHLQVEKLYYYFVLFQFTLRDLSRHYLDYKKSLKEILLRVEVNRKKT